MVAVSSSGHYCVLWWDGTMIFRLGAHGGEQGGAGHGHAAESWLRCQSLIQVTQNHNLLPRFDLPDCT